jgi:hypothetical protein
MRHRPQLPTVMEGGPRILGRANGSHDDGAYRAWRFSLGTIRGHRERRAEQRHVRTLSS